MGEEAQGDLVRASEARLRKQSALSLRQRLRCEAQRVQLERLKVVWELIQLQKRCQGLLASKEVALAALRGYDLRLVEELTSEAWYLEARETAAQLCKEDAPDTGLSPCGGYSGDGCEEMLT